MFFLSRKESKARVREAGNARRNRDEIRNALSTGQITRRDLLKAGIFTAGGLLVPIHGLSPFAKSAFASVPTGAPGSPYPIPTDRAFLQPLLRCDNMTPHQLTSTGGSDAQLMWPSGVDEAPAMRRANTNIVRHKVRLADAANTGNDVWVGGTTGPQEGRAPGEAFAHQRWNELVNGYRGATGADGEVSHPLPPVGFVMSLGQIAPGISYNLANNWHAQEPSAVWTFCEGKFERGRLPPYLMQARYGETVINRIYNNLPFYDPQWASSCFPDCVNTSNGGFGRQEPAIHNHNGHNSSDSDGAQNCHFFPGQYYDYNYSLMLARRDAGLKDSRGRDLDKLLRVKRGDPRCSTPTDDGGIIQLPGDFREIQGSLWFHDHRISYTSENVYKGFAALLEYFSGTDRGYERPLGNTAADKVNLRLPSGWRNKKTWGNRDFDIYLAIQDVAFNRDAQLYFDIFDTNGFLGDVMHVNYQWKPTLDVLPRKYRFRTLSAGMSRWIKLGVADSLDPSKAMPVPITVIANDGNLFPRFVRNVREMDIQATAERYDFVIDFSKFKVGQKLYLVNMLKHKTGEKFDRKLTLRDALSARAQREDPCVGAIMEFRIASRVPSIDEPGAMNTIANSCGANDMSLVNDPGADWEIPTVQPVRTRVIELVRGADGGGLPFDHPDGPEPWGIKVNGGDAYQADMRRVSNLPRPGDVEHWIIKSGGGWGHPLHLHFEEAKTIARTTGMHPTEANKRKDVWHVGNVGNVKFQVAFGEFGGAYVNHCHNTVHEDNAMLLRYDVIRGNSNATNIDDVHTTVLPTPDPRPEGVTYVDSSARARTSDRRFPPAIRERSKREHRRVIRSNGAAPHRRSSPTLLGLGSDT
ncbi:MAG: multicopper oxidase domain-containing protein [Betaproteobacteria bacterium]|nr:multicopper oxidase domain-containing protein [Betaproteobacteria bacterium]